MSFGIPGTYQHPGTQWVLPMVADDYVSDSVSTLREDEHSPRQSILDGVVGPLDSHNEAVDPFADW